MELLVGVRTREVHNIPRYPGSLGVMDIKLNMVKHTIHTMDVISDALIAMTVK